MSAPLERVTELECPCCGETGAVADARGLFGDGDALVCGCAGAVHIDDAGPDEPEAYVWIDDSVECPKCGDDA